MPNPIQHYINTIQKTQNLIDQQTKKLQQRINLINKQHGQYQYIMPIPPPPHRTDIAQAIAQTTKTKLQITCFEVDFTHHTNNPQHHGTHYLLHPPHHTLKTILTLGLYHPPHHHLIINDQTITIITTPNHTPLYNLLHPPRYHLLDHHIQTKTIHTQTIELNNPHLLQKITLPKNPKYNNQTEQE